MPPATERVRIPEVVRLTGLQKRHVQKLAKQGRIPGAGLLGGVWTFDRLKLGAWIRKAEADACTTSIEEDPPGGSEFKLTDENVDEAYGRLLGL